MSLESILHEVELYKGPIDRDEMRAWYTDRIADLHLPQAEHEAAIKTLCERLGCDIESNGIYLMVSDHRAIIYTSMR